MRGPTRFMPCEGVHTTRLTISKRPSIRSSSEGFEGSKSVGDGRCGGASPLLLRRHELAFWQPGSRLGVRVLYELNRRYPALALAATLARRKSA